MTARMHLAKKAFGLLLVAAGFAGLVADLHVAYVNRAGAHLLNIVISGLLIFVGGWLLNPPDAEAIADAIAKRIPVFSSLWPGGMRKTDPPPAPGVEPPPSVTGKPASPSDAEGA